MLQDHLHPTERSIYAFSVLCFIGFVALLGSAGSHPRMVSGAFAAMTQRTVTASVEEAQNFAAERLCRGVVSNGRCAAFVTPATL